MSRSDAAPSDPADTQQTGESATDAEPYYSDKYGYIYFVDGAATSTYSDEQRRALTADILKTSGYISGVQGVDQRLDLLLKLKSDLKHCSAASMSKDDSAEAVAVALK